VRQRLGALGMGACSTAYSFYVLRTAIESYYHSTRVSRCVGGCSAGRAYYMLRVLICKCICRVVLSFIVYCILTVVPVPVSVTRNS
jgi:hypothetical protein